MTPEDTAYALAEQLIAEAKAGNHACLNLSGLIFVREFEGERRAGDEALRALTTLPPQIAELSTLRGLDLDNTQVADLTPLSPLTGLQELYLNNTQVADLTPLSPLTGLQELSFHTTQVADLTWRAPIGWSGLVVSASLVSGPLARCF
ncbi:MAG: leucine-rich repeat domain-containing protein, partial [Pseudomonadota bacterium]